MHTSEGSISTPGNTHHRVSVVCSAVRQIAELTEDMARSEAPRLEREITCQSWTPPRKHHGEQKGMTPVR